MITYIADLLLISGAVAAGIYCIILSRRLAQLNNLEQGVGAAVQALSGQVDDLSATLGQARAAAAQSNGSLEGLTKRAEEVARQLELMLAALHDLPALGNDQEAAQSAAPDIAFKHRPESRTIL